MPQKFEESMLFPLFLEAVSGPYSIMRHKKPSGRNDILHRQTCPICGNTLVNLYRIGSEWKCRKCWEKGERNG